MTMKISGPEDLQAIRHSQHVEKMLDAALDETARAVQAEWEVCAKLELMAEDRDRNRRAFLCVSQLCGVLMLVVIGLAVALWLK